MGVNLAASGIAAEMSSQRRSQNQRKVILRAPILVVAGSKFQGLLATTTFDPQRPFLSPKIRFFTFFD